VPAAANRGQKPMRACEVDSLDDVGGASATGDQCGMAIERAVPESPRLVISFILREEQLASQAGSEVFEIRR
jgi:hypothetical protein